MARRDRSELLGMTRIEKRSEFIRSLNRTVVAVLCLGVGVLVVASSVPERKQLAAKDLELTEVLSLEAEVREAKTACEIEHRALREDPEFLETMARDRLDYSQPGERVLRIQREK